jgi:hypothetical protein
VQGGGRGRRFQRFNFFGRIGVVKGYLAAALQAPMCGTSGVMRVGVLAWHNGFAPSIVVVAFIPCLVVLVVVSINKHALHSRASLIYFIAMT